MPFDKKVVVVAADERSIERFGLWPWSRNRYAELVDRPGGRYAEMYEAWISHLDADDGGAGPEVVGSGAKG